MKGGVEGQTPLFVNFNICCSFNKVIPFLLVLFVALILFALAVVQFYYNWRVQPVSIFLSFSLVVIVVMSLTHYFFCYGTSKFWLAVFFNHFTPLYLLLGPLLFFYVRGTLNDRKGLVRSDLWHFLPFLFALMVILPYLFTPWSYKLMVADEIIRDYRNISDIPRLIDHPPVVNFLVRNVSAFGYTIYCIWMVFRFERHYPTGQRIPMWHARFALRFMKLLLFVCLFAELMFTALYGMYFADTSLTAIQLASNPLMSVLLLGLSAIPVVIIFNPEVLYGIPRMTRAVSYVPVEPAVQEMASAALSEASPTAVSVSPEVEDRFQVLADRILRLMEERKPYLDPDFSIEDLVRLLEVPRHHLYYCFNSILNIRFTRLRAEYRVRHVQQLIRDGQTETKTLDAIGIESGFASSASFRAVFKEVTGMSPREFQQSLAG